MSQNSFPGLSFAGVSKPFYSMSSFQFFKSGGAVVVSFLLLLFTLCQTLGAQSAISNAPPLRVEETNSQETLRAYLQLQEQIHSTQIAIERNRKEIDDAAAQRAETLDSRLGSIEKALATQRAQELTAMQSSNKVMLLVAGSFAAVGFVAMLLMAYFQWRTVNRLAEISASMPGAGARALLPGRAFAALGAGDTQVVDAAPREQPGAKLLEVIERLEKRIHELEHTTHHQLHENHSAGNGSRMVSSAGDNEKQGKEGDLSDPDNITVMLGKGQSLLNMDKAEEALTCFEAVLSAEPSHAEALVKKGTALERLRRFNEAIQCYDKAILANPAMTIAYLHKGGLFNRMERFSEALECYEKALHTQEQKS
jgi:tetratricopeptide (TPR) repeat protein